MEEDVVALAMAMVAMVNKGHLQTITTSFVTRMVTLCIGAGRDLIIISRVKRSLLMRWQPHHRMRWTRHGMLIQLPLIMLLGSWTS
jgi:hypothetical protein